MIVIRESIVSGKVSSMDLPITDEQLKLWNEGTLVHRAFPELTPCEREFIMTGITPQEWDDTFGGEEA